MFDTTTMKRRKAKIRYRGVPGKTWTIESIFPTNTQDPGKPFKVYGFASEGTDSVSALEYTGSKFSTWIGKTFTFNMSVSGLDDFKPLTVVFASPAIVARSLAAQAADLTAELKTLAEDLEAIFPEESEPECESQGETVNAEG